MPHNLRRLGELRDFEVARHDPDVRGWGVQTRDGRAIGEVEELIVDPEARKVRFLEVDLDREGMGLSDNRRVSIPVESAEIDRHRHTVLVDGFSREAIAGMPASDDTLHGSARGMHEEGAHGAAGSRPEAASRVRDDLRRGPEQARGGVVVGKHMETEHVSQPVTVEREQVRVERRPVAGDIQNREVRMENGEIRIPITEEQIVVEKRPVVKEELVVSKETVREVRNVEADVQRERYDVRDESGRVLRDSDYRGGE